MKSFDTLPEFKKEFKRLLKKYGSLDDDLENLKKVLKTSPTGIGINFTIIYSSKSIKIVKARMACRALRERSLRLIYAYLEYEKKIDFIEIYFKGKKENEDRDRIRTYLSNVE